MKKILLSSALAAACLLVSGSKVTAQTSSDLGTWSSLQIVKPWDKPYLMARLEHRSFDHVSATECYFASAGAGTKVTPWLKADLSYEYWKVPSAGDISINKAIASATATLRRETLAVSIREKYEQAFYEGGKSTGTLRSRLRAQYGIPDSIFTPYVMSEHFQTMGKGWQRSLHYAGTEIAITPRQSLDLFYMYHLFPSATGTASCHVLGICYGIVL